MCVFVCCLYSRVRAGREADGRHRHRRQQRGHPRRATMGARDRREPGIYKRRFLFFTLYYNLRACFFFFLFLLYLPIVLDWRDIGGDASNGAHGQGQGRRPGRHPRQRGRAQGRTLYRSAASLQRHEAGNRRLVTIPGCKCFCTSLFVNCSRVISKSFVNKSPWDLESEIVVDLCYEG